MSNAPPHRVRAGSLAEALGLNAEQAIAAWQALSSVVSAESSVSSEAGRLLAVAAHALGVAAEPVATADRSLHARIAAAFPGPDERRALVDVLVIAVCIDGSASEPRERAAKAIAHALDVASPWIALLPALRKGRILALRRALASRSPDARRLVRRIWKEEGLAGAWRTGLFLLGLHRDAPLAARFHALADAPVGSFGRAVADHFRSRGISVPGEKDGMPEKMVHHDLLHVLNGYDTDPAGECELAAFYTALSSVADDTFTFVVTVLASFHLGLPVSPALVKPARGAFDPERAVAAFLRGRSVTVDVMGAWDYWALMPLPIAEARTRIGLPAEVP